MGEDPSAPECCPRGEPVRLRPVPVDQVAPSVLQVAERGLSIVGEPGTEWVLVATETKQLDLGILVILVILIHRNILL